MVKLVTGNLFEAKVEALVNPVNTVGVMGKGLALAFKKAFPANTKAYEAACRRRELAIGKVLVFEIGEAALPRYILNFPSKAHWRDPSKLEYIEAGMKDLVRVLAQREIRSVAIPALGAGLGGLDWKVVRPIVMAPLARLPNVEALVFEPTPPPPTHSR